MITFRPIDKGNFYPLLELDPGDRGKFVASAAVSLAEAWLYYEEHNTFPFALYAGEELVGYMMAHEDPDRKALFLWRLAIAKEHQGKGYGTEALRKFIALARESGEYACLVIGYEAGNDRAGRMYERLGFRPTGTVEDGETILRLDF